MIAQMAIGELEEIEGMAVSRRWSAARSTASSKRRAAAVGIGEWNLFEQLSRRESRHERFASPAYGSTWNIAGA
jgi:hypothetical protein